MSPFPLFVIPGLTRNTVFIVWIPAFAEMTVSESTYRTVRFTALTQDPLFFELRLQALQGLFDN